MAIHDLPICDNSYVMASLLEHFFVAEIKQISFLGFICSTSHQLFLWVSLRETL